MIKFIHENRIPREQQPMKMMDFHISRITAMHKCVEIDHTPATVPVKTSCQVACILQAYRLLVYYIL